MQSETHPGDVSLDDESSDEDDEDEDDEESDSESDQLDRLTCIVCERAFRYRSGTPPSWV